MTARELTDFTKGPLTKQFQAKGTSGSSLIEELQPVIVTHVLEDGPNPPFVRWASSALVSAVAGQFANAGYSFRDGALAPQSEQTLIIDSVIADVTYACGIGNTGALSTPQGQATCRDMDGRNAVVSGGLWLAAFVDDIVPLFGASATDRITGNFARVSPNIETKPSFVLPRRQYLENAGVFPAFWVQSESLNVSMRFTVRGRLFYTKP